MNPFLSKKNAQQLQKLEEAFLMDCNIGEACQFAGISRSTWEDYCLEYPDEKERLLGLRSNVKIKAKKILARKISHVADSVEIPDKEDADLGLKYLKSRAPDEFSEKQKTEHSGSVTLGSLIEEIARENENK